MRAPPFARMAAVAAPRPEAEPVTIAHKPSFDIRISSCCFWLGFEPPVGRGPYHIALKSARKSEEIRCAEFILCAGIIMPPSQAALRTALVTAMAFAHHKAQEKDCSRARHNRWDWHANFKSGNAVAESENIVAETAEKIFADLADAQTINRDNKGAWKAPLWQALTEAGLPLAWVPEDCGGSGASLAEGFSVLSAAGRFAVAVPLAETMLAGWLLAQAGIASPDGEMTVVPASPKDRITVNADGSLSGKARSVPFAKAARHVAVLAGDAKGSLSIALVDATKCRIETGLGLGGDNSDMVTLDKVQPVTIKPAPSGL